MKFAALVMAGGQSSRMGTNKALLQAHPGGSTLIEIVVEKVRQAGAQEVLIVANVREPYEFLGLPIVEDAVAGAGPLGGIMGGLHASNYEQNLVVACDMPNINPLVIQHMAALTGECDAVVPRWIDSSGAVHVEPLHAIYARAAQPKLEACIADGVFALHGCLQGLHVRYVEEEELSHFGNAADMFQNINRPDDWTLFTGT